MILELTNNLMGIAREDEAVKVSFVDKDQIISKQEPKGNEQRRQENQEIRNENNKMRKKNEFVIYFGFGIFIILIALFLLIFS
jgi:predicted nucleic acid-binding Zn ribbon protein